MVDVVVDVVVGGDGGMCQNYVQFILRVKPFFIHKLIEAMDLNFFLQTEWREMMVTEMKVCFYEY